jgi:hypothetical protein
VDISAEEQEGAFPAAHRDATDGQLVQGIAVGRFRDVLEDHRWEILRELERGVGAPVGKASPR